MRLKNNGEQTENKKEEKFSKRSNEPTFDIDQDDTMGPANNNLAEHRWWLVLSRYTYNNKINKKIIVGDTMLIAVSEFLRCQEPCEEFLTITEIEPDALQVIASTL